MKCQLRLPEASTIVYHFAKLIGLAPFTLKKDGVYALTLLGILYSILIIATHFSFRLLTIIQIWRIMDKNKDEIYTKVMLMLRRAINLGIICLSLMTFLLQHKKIAYIMNKLVTMSSEFKNLGVEEYHGKWFRNILVITVIANVVIVAAYVALSSLELYWPILMKIEYSIDGWYQLNMILIFTQLLFFIKHRFTLVNQELQNTLTPGIDHRSLNHSQISMRSRDSCEETQDIVEVLANSQRIRKIRILHLDLCNVAYQATRLFAIPIFLMSFRSTIELIEYSFYICIKIQYFYQTLHDLDINVFVTDILPTLIKILITIIELIPIADVCVAFCEEGNATKAVLRKLWYTYKPRELEDQIAMLSLQLMQTPVNARILGCLNLDYTLIGKIFGIVLVYVAIMIQFDIVLPHIQA